MGKQGMRTFPITTYYGVGQRHHEYTSQIDFRVSMKDNLWRVMTLVRLKNTLSEKLCDMRILESFDFEYKDLATYCVFTFNPLDTKEQDLTKARRGLLGFLNKHNLRIIWKEDLHGYEIDSSGKIYRKWPLDSAPIEAETIEVPERPDLDIGDFCGAT